MSEEAYFSPEYFINDGQPPEVGLIKKGYVVPDDDKGYGCYYAVDHDEPISWASCVYPRAKIDTVKDSVLTAEYVLDRMRCFYFEKPAAPYDILNKYGKENWMDYKVANKVDAEDKPTKVYVTIITKAAYVDNDPNDYTPVKALYFLSCKKVSQEGPYNPKESFFSNILGDCGYSDCNNDGGCGGFGGEVVPGKDCRNCPNEPLCGWAWQSRYYCCKKKNISQHSITGATNLRGAGCYSFLVDLSLGAKGTYCLVPRKTPHCEMESVTQTVPDVCFPSNQKFGTPDRAECKAFLDSEISTSVRDVHYRNLCSYYPTLTACSCIHAEDLPEYKELVKWPTFRGQLKGCFWRQCQDSKGAVFVTEEDRPDTCRSINCINWVHLEGLTQNQVDSLNQNVICEINDSEPTDPPDGGTITPTPSPGDSNSNTGSPSNPITNSPVFQDGDTGTTLAAGEGEASWTDMLGENGIYIGIGVVVLLFFIGGGYMVYSAHNEGSTEAKKEETEKVKAKTK